MEKYRARLTQSLGHQASDEELAAALDIDSEYIKELTNMHQDTVSLNGLFEMEGTIALAEFVIDHFALSPEEAVFEEVDRKERVEEACVLLDQLEPNEAAIIRLLSKFETDEVLTIEEAGRKLGFSRDRAWQLKKRAFSKLLRLAYGQPATGDRPPTTRIVFPEVLEFDYDGQPAMMEMQHPNSWMFRLADESHPPADTDWLKSGHCLEFALGAFYTGRGESTYAAQAVCLECPVKTSCLEYALKHDLEGIWGATTGRIRRRIKKRRLEIRLAKAAEE